ncbi:MAG: hypothetical protein J7K17_05735 [Candidatus Omnitrophica bacterium]|nr:hypothetical protein [Candidatus Omnitrophota bacterium]
MISELVNKKGDKIPLKHLSLRTESINTKGSLKYPNDTVVKKEKWFCLFRIVRVPQTNLRLFINWKLL